MLLVLFQVGCYSYLPMQTEVPRSGEVMVQLNDRGRVDVSAGMGPNVEAIEGLVVGADSATVRLKVSRVVYFRGGSSIWAGEEVTIAQSGVSGFRTRQFSKGRTWTLAGLVAAVLVISVITADLDLFNNEPDPDRCIGPTCGTNPSVRQ